jgi:hypothetical protein
MTVVVVIGAYRLPESRILPAVPLGFASLLLVIRRGRPDDEVGRVGIVVAVCLVALALAFSAWTAVQMV